MLSSADLTKFAGAFGAADGQIRRDHIISHVLAALPSVVGQDWAFFGGTALWRTYLDGMRLSEDIDLLCADYESFLGAIQAHLPAALRREFPDSRVKLGPVLGEGRQAWLTTAGSEPVRLYAGAGHLTRTSWTFTDTQVSLRYLDLPPRVELSCPTLATFAAMKLESYYDSHSPRDLFDLAGMAGLGAFSAEANRIMQDALGYGFVRQEFSSVPGQTLAAWQSELAYQVRELPTADSCRRKVAKALG